MSSITNGVSSVVPRKATNNNYKPVILKTASLVTLILLTFSLIGVLQYALIRLPTIQGRFGLDRRSEIENAATLQTSDSAEPKAITRSHILEPPPTFLEVRADSTVTPTATASVPSSIYVPEEVSITSPDIPIGTTAPSVYVPIEITTIYPDVPAPTTAPSVYVPTETTITSPNIASSSAPSAYVPTETTITLSSASAGVYVPFETTGIFPAASGGINPSQSVSKPGTGSAPPSGNASVGDHVPSQETKGVTVLRWSPLHVFLGTYLAVMLAVIYRILISIVQTQLRLIDPFRQLASSEGALASTALFTAYHSQAWFGPFVALRTGRYALSSIGLVFWVSCLLPAFASEAIFVDTKWSCPDPEVGVPNPCPPRITASISVVRLLQSLLGFGAIVLLGIIFALRSEIGLESDPSSIAAVATLMGHPSLQHDLNSLPSGPESTGAMMKQEMGQRRYRLDTWVDRICEQHRGIVPAFVAYNDPNNENGHRNRHSTAVNWLGTTGNDHSIDPRSSAYNTDAPSHQWRWDDFLLLLMITGAFSTVVAYYFVGGDNGFNKFFNSSTFGPRFILTGSATLIANIWGGVEENSTVMAPFIRLANSSSSFDTLSFGPTITPILSTWRALSRGYWFAGTVTIMTLLAEVLSVSISGVPFSTGQTWLNFLVVAYISMAILGVMILATIAVFIHRRREPKIPVVPDTLGAKMSYIAGSKMVRIFSGSNASYSGNRLRGGRFRFQLVAREDGRRCWKVEQVESL